ncbi:WD-40 repeat-containing protein MSI5-like isoform X1 [Apium graveolens]|uniref:WD-40 repeat-containing protein MSI5-like isoform X1 n=1 Tax=Apium graveolens TaxID=4045 RepID=UPI003D790318
MIPALYCGIGRSGFTPTVKVEKAHDADLHCVDWNPHDVNFILTGSADNSVGIFDRRNFTSGPVHIFPGHSEAVLCVQWSPDRASVFGSSAEDGVLNIWDHKLAASSLACARRGWVNVGFDKIECESCSANLKFSALATWMSTR